MSLTTDIANLVARYAALADLFDAKKNSINAAVAAALATIPEVRRNVYLDAINGNDNNDGLTTAKAVRTFAKALELGGPGRLVNISLMSDITLTQARYMLEIGQHVRISSYGYIYGEMAQSVVRKIILTPQPREMPDAVGDWQVSSLYCPTLGVNNSLSLQTVEIVFPAAPATGIMVPDYYNGLLSMNQGAGPSYTAIEMHECKITRPAGSVGVICGARQRMCSLIVKSSTYTSADMAGRWLANTAAGTTPASIDWLASNLATL